MSVNYDHSLNIHSLIGPQAALPIIFEDLKPSSLLDVGCGTGTWMKAALDFGVTDVFGVDGVANSPDKLHISAEKIKHQDLTHPWNLKRKFDAVICLEVAEHLDSTFAPILIDTLIKHGERIYFSAACPGQTGQHHVNCQWPFYWQKLFNDRGYVCSDAVRWRIWETETVEPWYRQNIFIAQYAPHEAGKESRLRSVVHPAIANLMITQAGVASFPEHVAQIEQGRMTVGWCVWLPFRALANKLRKHL